MKIILTTLGENEASCCNYCFINNINIVFTISPLFDLNKYHEKHTMTSMYLVRFYFEFEKPTKCKLI